MRRILMRAFVLVTLAPSLFGSAGCRILGMKPAPEGVSNVKSVGKAPAEWKDGEGGVWRIREGALAWNRATGHCRGLALELDQRWRLPSIEELERANEMGIGSAKNKAFGWVDLGNVWAADWERSFGDEISGGYVDMNTGKAYRVVFDDIENTTLCVRTDTQGNTWYDGAGRSWWYVQATMDYETAVVTCAELAKRLHKPWRLPTPEELKAAVGLGIQQKSNKAFGRDYIRYTWSRTIGARIGSEEAYATDLRNGVTHLTDIDENIAVVCVMPNQAKAEKIP